MLGVLASVNYAYDDTYLLDASFRLDGSSAFGTDQRFAPFWSGGLGINIHKYGFMEDVSWINRLKLRGSFGQTGKANFPAYDARSSYVILSDEWYKTGYGAVLQALGNTQLKWETTNTTGNMGRIHKAINRKRMGKKSETPPTIWNTDCIPELKRKEQDR